MIAPSYWIDPKTGNNYLLTVQYPENLVRSIAEGSEAHAPLARAIIGGLAASVILTVFIVPAAFLFVYQGRERRKAAERQLPPLALDFQMGMLK